MYAYYVVCSLMFLSAVSFVYLMHDRMLCCKQQITCFPQCNCFHIDCRSCQAWRRRWNINLKSELVTCRICWSRVRLRYVELLYLRSVHSRLNRWMYEWLCRFMFYAVVKLPSHRWGSLSLKQLDYTFVRLGEKFRTSIRHSIPPCTRKVCFCTQLKYTEP